MDDDDVLKDLGPTLAGLPQLRELTLVNIGLVTPQKFGAIVEAAPLLEKLILLVGRGTQPRAWAEPDEVRFALSLSLALSLSPSLALDPGLVDPS